MLPLISVKVLTHIRACSLVLHTTPWNSSVGFNLGVGPMRHTKCYTFVSRVWKGLSDPNYLGVIAAQLSTLL